jgi:hypothetical protein
MKPYGGSGYIDPSFLDLGTSWKWAVNFKPRPFYPRGKSPGTHLIGGWVSFKAGVDDVEKRKVWLYRGSNSEPSAVHTVASRYTDWAILALPQLSTYFKRHMVFRSKRTFRLCREQLERLKPRKEIPKIGFSWVEKTQDFSFWQRKKLLKWYLFSWDVLYIIKFSIYLFYKVSFCTLGLPPVSLILSIA